MAQLEINAGIQISKPVREVFDAIVDPGKMSGYFIAEGDGVMETGREIVWKFPEFEDGFTIKVLTIKANELISFEWPGAKDRQLQVDMYLSQRPGNATLVKITEGKMDNNEDGIKWLKSNTEGWANFLACLKAYLEYGINLRKGAFDFIKG